MERKIQLTNQGYRKALVKNAFEVMKSNQREYSKQSNLYIPKGLLTNNEKMVLKNK